MAVSYITNAALAQQISDLLAKWQIRETQMQTWIGGSATGGDFANGTYPLSDVLGSVRYTLSPAALELEVTGLATSASAFAAAAAASATAAAGSATAAAASATTATTQAGIATAKAILAAASTATCTSLQGLTQAEANAALASQVAAAASAAAAVVSASGAAGSATAAATSATAAAGSATAAAASAVLAATFTPALYALLAGAAFTGVVSITPTSGTGLVVHGVAGTTGMQVSTPDDGQLQLNALSGGRFATLEFAIAGSIKSEIFWDNVANSITCSSAFTVGGVMTFPSTASTTTLAGANMLFGIGIAFSGGQSEICTTGANRLGIGTSGAADLNFLTAATIRLQATAGGWLNDGSGHGVARVANAIAPGSGLISAQSGGTASGGNAGDIILIY